jgi:hypothetical protein
MANPYFAYQNLLPSATITARTESSVYPATNLTKHRLWPGWRSGDQCLILNGTDEYAYVADHADFDITGDFTIEALIYPQSVTGLQLILNKSQANTSGWSLNLDGSEVEVYALSAADGGVVKTSGANLAINNWYRIKAVYDASVPEITFYVNGTLVSSSVTVAPGTSIDTNAIRVTVGASSAGTSRFTGKIAYVGIEATEYDHGGYLDPSSCAGYWDMAGLNGSSKIADVSGNSHDLTVSGIADPDNFTTCTAYQWVRFTLPSTQNPTYCFFDRRHNITDELTITLHRQSPFAAYTAGGAATDTVTADAPIIFDISSITETDWWIEIHDPDNTDGYIEIPYIYLGAKSDLSRGFGNSYLYSPRTHGNIIADSVGGYTAYVRSEQLLEHTIVFKLLAADFAIIEAIADVARLGQPVVFSEDSTDAKTRLVYWVDAMNPRYQKIIDPNPPNSTIDQVTMQLNECGGGL